MVPRLASGWRPLKTPSGLVSLAQDAGTVPSTATTPLQAASAEATYSTCCSGCSVGIVEEGEVRKRNSAMSLGLRLILTIFHYLGFFSPSRDSSTEHGMARSMLTYLVPGSTVLVIVLMIVLMIVLFHGNLVSVIVPGASLI